MSKLKELLKSKSKNISIIVAVAVVAVLGAVIANAAISSDNSMDRAYQAELEANVASPIMEVTNKALLTKTDEKWKEESSKKKAEEEESKRAEELKQQEEEKAKQIAEEKAKQAAEEEKKRAAEEEKRKAAEEEAKKAARGNVIVCLDPGHGGAENGTFYRDENVSVHEKDINYQIALGVKARLEALGIKVIMTRNGDYNVGLRERVAIADNNGAQIVVSIHNNASSKNLQEHRGCMVVTQSNYNNVKEESLAIAYPILAGLKALGIEYSSDWDASSHNGILQRVDEPISYYPDGSVADYYAIINESTLRGLPSVIVEHAFLNNKDDYYEFFSTPQKIDALAQADANGIIAYLSGKGYL